MPTPLPRRYLALLSVLLVCLSQGSAQANGLDPLRPVSAYSTQHWGTAQGLPSNTVEAVIQGPGGQIWFATTAGLARLEGTQARSWDREHFADLASPNFTSLALGTMPGVLWVGTFGNGLVRFDSQTGHYQVFTEKDGLCGDYVRALARDKLGTLWIGTSNHLACRLTDDGFLPIPIPGPEAGAVVDIAPDQGGGAYLAALSDALYYQPPGSEPLQLLEGLPAPASSVLVGPQGDVFVGTTGRGVHRYLWDSARFVPVGNGPLAEAFVRALAADGAGTLWVATTSQGAFRLRDAHRGHITPSDRLDVQLATDMLVDTEASLWITTQGQGVEQLLEDRFSTISARHGLSNENVWSLWEARDGGLYIGTGAGGLFRHTGGLVEPVGGAHGPLSDAVVLSLYEDGQGTLWAALYGQGLARIQGSEITLITPEQGIASTRTSVVQGDSNGNLWIGHFQGGVDRWRDGEVHHFREAHGLPSEAITAIHETRAGDLWLGTRGAGAARLQEGRFELITTADGLCSDEVNAIHESADGALWFATADGLCRLQGDSFLVVRAAQGLPSREVLDLTQDHRGDFWLASPNGIVHIRREELARLAAHEVDRLQATLHDTRHGMLDAECNGGTQRNLLAGRDGTIYVATTRGVVVVEPLRAFIEAEPPGAAIAQVLVGGHSQPFLQLDGPLVAGRRGVDLELRYLPTGHRHPELTRFRYQLVGLDAAWVQADQDRVARYAGLREGRYEFRVQAGQGGEWLSAPATLGVRVTSMPWHWRWPWAVLGAAVLLGVFLSLRRRYVANWARIRELESSNEDTRRELQQAALVDPLTGLRNRRFAAEVVLPEVVAFIAQQVRLREGGASRRGVAAEAGVYGIFLFDIDHFKRINDTLGHQAGDRMLQQFSYLLRRSVRQDDFVIRWGGEEFLVVLRLSDRDHLDAYARRIRQQVEQTTFLLADKAGGALKKTTSLGYVSLPFFDEVPDLLEFEQAIMLADHALYQAKEGGRNRAARLVSTGKLPDATDLVRMVSSLEWALEHGYLHVQIQEPKEGG